MDALQAKRISEVNQIPKILEKIEKAATAGRRKLYIYDTLSNQKEEEIRSKGFELVFDDELNRYEISW